MYQTVYLRASLGVCANGGVATRRPAAHVFVAGSGLVRRHEARSAGLDAVGTDPIQLRSW